MCKLTYCFICLSEQYNATPPAKVRVVYFNPGTLLSQQYFNCQHAFSIGQGAGIEFWICFPHESPMGATKAPTCSPTTGLCPQLYMFQIWRLLAETKLKKYTAVNCDIVFNMVDGSDGSHRGEQINLFNCHQQLACPLVSYLISLAVGEFQI